MSRNSGSSDALALRRNEAAQLLGISERYLAELTKRGEIPVVRLGRKCIRYRAADLEDYLAGQQSSRGGS